MKSYLDPLKCAYCSKHINEFVKPEVPRNPRLIIVGEAPGAEELRQGVPFVGPSGKVLRTVLPVDAVIVNAANVYSPDKPTTEIINIERESHLLPLLAEYKDLPVVSLGAFAAQSLLGGKRSDSSMAGQALWLHGRPVLFTYHPAYYLYSHKDERILKHIEAHILAALASPLKHNIRIDTLPKESTGSFVLDIESTGKDLPFYGTQVVLFGVRVGSSVYQFTASWLAKKANVKALQAWINVNKQVIGHNVMFDILQAEAVGLTFNKLGWYDTMLAVKDKGHDLYSGFGLKALARSLYHAAPWEAKFHTYLKDKVAIETIPIAELSPYNAGDLYYTSRLAEARSVARDNNPFVALDNDYLRYVKQMVSNGIFVSTRKLALMLRHYQRERAKAEVKARKLVTVGKDFNFNSPKQLLPLVQSLVGPIENTREQTLTTVLDKHPFIPALLEIRGTEKTIELLEKTKGRIVPATGLVHTTATVHGAETSRTTTKDPNIQNWPEVIRSMLRSRYKNGRIIYPDLSQIEYRLIGHETQEPKLVRIFKEGGDIHNETYKDLVGRYPKNKEERKPYKTANYAEIYGVGLAKLAFLTSLSYKKAKELKAKVRGRYPYVDDYKAELEDRLMNDDPAKIVNVFGRVRYMSLSEFYGDTQREKVRNALREAFNWVFQSSGHDILKLWTMEVLDLIDDPEVLFIDDVHDEFVLDVPGAKVKSVLSSIKFVSDNLNELINSAFGVRLRVPITAEIEYGKHWK